MRERLEHSLGAGYLGTDFSGDDATERIDITDIQHDDDSFDVIYCSHVLEHIQDDRRAMAELYRVLKPSGWAVLQVPITADKTMEDAGVTDPESRLEQFGQQDHVRRYGPDFENRLLDAGFAVEKIGERDFLSEEERNRISVRTEAAGDVFYCTK